MQVGERIIQIGKYVRVISKANYLHYKKFGRVVGYSENNHDVKVYFDDTGLVANLCKESLELIN